MIEIVRASELGESYRVRISEVFVDGFGEYLDYFCKDRRKLAEALAHMLVLDLFYVALVDGEPAGMAACTNGTQLCVQHDRKQLRRHLGFVKGTIADVVFEREFQKPWDHSEDGLGSIEFVATASAYRGQGVATTLLRHLLALPQYDTYMLEEIADTNTPAIRLYEKLGFQEYKRVKVNHTRRTGINYYVSMRLTG